jgi:hypothetical protein
MLYMNRLFIIVVCATMSPVLTSLKPSLSWSLFALGVASFTYSGGKLHDSACSGVVSDWQKVGKDMTFQ